VGFAGIEILLNYVSLAERIRLLAGLGSSKRS
jgi:hypothetical protein